MRRMLPASTIVLGLICVGFVACSGSSNTAPPVRSTPTPTPMPSPTPTLTPIASSRIITDAVVVGTPIPLPSAGGYGGSIAFESGGSVPAGTELVEQTFAGPPPAAPIAQAHRRFAATPTPSPTVLVAEDLQYTSIPASVVPLLASIPTVITFTGPAFTTGDSYVAELFDVRTGALVQRTSGFVSNNTVSFIDALIGMQTLDPYVLEVVVDSALPAPTPTPSPTATPTTTPTPTPSSPPAASPSPLPTIGGNEKIYVANFYPNFDPNLPPGSITVYSANATGSANDAPLATINGFNTGLDQPGGVALDASGKIYACNTRITDLGPPSVTVYAANPSGTLDEAPLATIQGSNTDLSFPEGIALDASGKIYVANTSNVITIYAANPSGTLNEAPLATISGANTQLEGSDAVALDASGRIYVANYESSSVTVYAAILASGTVNVAPLATIAGSATGIAKPEAIAVDASGRIYVAGYGGVEIFAPNPRGAVDEAPLAKLTNNQSPYPEGIAIDASGKIFVSYPNNEVRGFAFPPNPNSTEAPFVTIGGSNTGLHSPVGMSVR